MLTTISTQTFYPEAAKVESSIAGEEGVDGKDDEDCEDERQRSKNSFETIAAIRHARRIHGRVIELHRRV